MRFLQVRRGGPADREQPFHIDIHDLVPILRLQTFQVRHINIDSRAGAINQIVQLPELFDNRLHHCADFCILGDIRLNNDCFAAVFFNSGDSVQRFLLRTGIVDSHVDRQGSQGD